MNNFHVLLNKSLSLLRLDGATVPLVCPGGVGIDLSTGCSGGMGHGCPGLPSLLSCACALITVCTDLLSLWNPRLISTALSPSELAWL